MPGPSHSTSKVRAIQPHRPSKHIDTMSNIKTTASSHARSCMRSQSLARPGDFDRARTLYEKVLRARPYRQLLFYALNNLALLHDTTGNLERVEETLRYALQLSACGPHQSFCRQCHKSHGLQTYFDGRAQSTTSFHTNLSVLLVSGCSNASLH